MTAEEINEALITASQGSLEGILQFTTEPLVSIDFNTNPHSAIIDGLSTMVIGDRKVKVLAWYDNEWGYSCRVVDLTKYVAQQMKTSVNV
ncbi:glyceraldehyde-3-phosphate dehydrogenase [Bacillus sp. SG-1]|nr:glyceraldehyde-3-phosphate dehydrogenase [Bacillus sp. SG-1]